MKVKLIIIIFIKNQIKLPQSFNNLETIEQLSRKWNKFDKSI